MSLTLAIKSEAYRLGFQLIGITTPDPPPHGAVFEHWIDEGRHGEMEYLATERSRQRRIDPRQVLPGCRSILVPGMRYPGPGQGSESLELRGEGGSLQPLQGRVASYAWGDDYHDALPKRLKEFVAFIEAQVGHPVPNRYYTDTGPILERDLAQRAGLGWIGKNTCLINPHSGSYFLLAEILLDLELEPDAPFIPDRCGSCTRCLEACPTNCILPDRTLDAQRCISYLTIELKGTIPIELRSQMGEWVFGCDICQQVCPWNQRFSLLEEAQVLAVDSVFHPRSEIPRPDLLEEIRLSQEEFGRKFKKSPVKRAKRRGYLRNVAVALGNAAAGRLGEEAIRALDTALRLDPEALVRGHAAWALGRIGGEAALQALREAEKTEAEEEVLLEIRAAIQEITHTS